MDEANSNATLWPHLASWDFSDFSANQRFQDRAECGNRTSEHMLKNQLRHVHKSKDDRKQTKMTGLISKDTEVKIGGSMGI